MQDDRGKTYHKSHAEHRSDAFDEGMAILCDMHKRELNHATIRAYFEPFEHSGEARVREAFRRALDSEKFFPSIATLKAYLAGVPDEQGRPIVEATREIVYTPEEAADIARMKTEIEETAKKMPWFGVNY
jgi:hypothetical protein